MEKKQGQAPHDYEERDLPLRKVAEWMGVLFALMLLSMAFCWVCFGLKPKPVDGRNVMTRPMSQPALQPQPAAEMKAFYAQEEQHLRHYGWVHKSSGKIHIPIHRAMDLALDRGFPVRGER